MKNKTTMLKKETVSHDWFVIDAKDKVLGRLASKIAVLLSGKSRVDWTPYVDAGAGVIVTNCSQIRLTGSKDEAKIYTSYSGYPGGLKKSGYKDMKEKKPKYILRHAVRGMLPKNRIADKMLRRLKLYEDDKYSHSAQKPKEVTV